MEDVENRGGIQATFQSIYQRKVWGGLPSDDFWSGPGSHEAQYVDPYVEAVRTFATTLDKKYDAVDLGCGDFNVGFRLRSFFEQYAACDVVPELIERNRKTFEGYAVEFHCLEMTSDPLPRGDVVIVRQVLQHLSNEKIVQLLPKFAGYKFLILTEGLPKGEFVPNLPIKSGADVRLWPLNSGVVITEPPFNLVAMSSRLLCDIPYGDTAVIRTTAFELS